MDMKTALIIWALGALLSLAFAAGVIWVAWHFISKF